MAVYNWQKKNSALTQCKSPSITRSQSSALCFMTSQLLRRSSVAQWFMKVWREEADKETYRTRQGWEEGSRKDDSCVSLKEELLYERVNSLTATWSDVAHKFRLKLSSNWGACTVLFCLLPHLYFIYYISSCVKVSMSMYPESSQHMSKEKARNWQREGDNLRKSRNKVQKEICPLLSCWIIFYFNFRLRANLSVSHKDRWLISISVLQVSGEQVCSCVRAVFLPLVGFTAFKS